MDTMLPGATRTTPTHVGTASPAWNVVPRSPGALRSDRLGASDCAVRLHRPRIAPSSWTRGNSSRRDACPVVAATASPTESLETLVKDIGACSIQGTSRAMNEDRFDYRVWESDPTALIGCWDGHGGPAVAEWLEAKMEEYVDKFWGQSPPEKAICQTYTAVDRQLLKAPKGFFGAMGERGVGGSKCGATGATALIYSSPDGKAKLLAANVGDSRVVLVQNGTARQLTRDHVPDVEEERKRIEATNPNPNMPLVRFVGNTWRVGGILALSRAFGDAYLKGSLQFEGIPAGDDNYSSGFGVVADPDVAVVDLPRVKGETWLLVHTDGLNDTSGRGGGGGLSNEQIAQMCKRMGKQGAEALAQSLAEGAQEQGSTDDVTVVCARLEF